MDFLVARVASRFRLALAEDDEPEFEDFLDEVYQGGEKKIPNPNADSREQFPQVSVSTALKNPAFLKHVYQEYEKWLGSKKAPEKPESKKEEPEKKPAGKSIVHALDISDKDIDSAISKHKDAFDKIHETMKAKAAQYAKKPQRSVMDAKTFNSLSEAEQGMFVAGHEVGDYFEKHVLKDKDTHKAVMRAWRASSGDPLSQELNGLLSSLGIPGDMPKDELDDKQYAKAREKGKSNKKLRAYLKEVTEFTQAYLKHAGVESLTVFRGVEGEGTEKAKGGQEVSVKCRQASSFTIDPVMAEAFGRVLEFKVPRENIFGSFLTNPDFGSPLAKRESGGALGESEAIILGASALKGKVRK